MNKIDPIIIENEITIKEAIKKLDDSGQKILFVTKDKKLIATLTDGDIRRWILKNGSLEESIKQIANYSPKFLKEAQFDRKSAREMMLSHMIECIPVVNENNDIISACFWYEIFQKEKHIYKKIDIPVVIMAGGKGTRLHPYTKILPKPLIPIGEKPIVEIIMDRFAEYGCSQFYLSVNYKANMIKAYFNELNPPYIITYFEEDKPLGTAGSLYLLKDKIRSTFFVNNCDVLIDADYYNILDFHHQKNNKITLVASLKNYTIPYGVIELDNQEKLSRILEKPEYNYLVNTGMYLLEKQVLNDIPQNEFMHITDIISIYLERGEKVGVFPISEKSWMDMGQMEELQDMLLKFGVS